MNSILDSDQFIGRFLTIGWSWRLPCGVPEAPQLSRSVSRTEQLEMKNLMRSRMLKNVVEEKQCQALTRLYFEARATSYFQSIL